MPCSPRKCQNIPLPPYRRDPGCSGYLHQNPFEDQDAFAGVSPQQDRRCKPADAGADHDRIPCFCQLCLLVRNSARHHAVPLMLPLCCLYVDIDNIRVDCKVAAVNIYLLKENMTRSEPYHHANLRQTLLDAAVTLIGEVGPRAFTLREVARRAGVSHNAPYRHFVSKDELLAEVAAEGFDRLTASMQKSMARGLSPLERLELCGCGYVAFALRWPHHFLVMFDLPQAPL